MKACHIMLIAGEASGDALAAELVKELAKDCAKPAASGKNARLEFFGAGGPKMAEAGVKIAVDMTPHAVIGLSEVLKNYGKFRHIFNDLLALALQQKPDLIILVDFSGFNRRFAQAVRQHLRHHRETDWSPKIVQYVSPQVWASRPGRADKMAEDFDLLLCLFPFEKEWYARRVPHFRVEFVGHPIFDRYAAFPFAQAKTAGELGAMESDRQEKECQSCSSSPHFSSPPRDPIILLLPGSRSGELKRHLPVMLPAARALAKNVKATFKLVLPDEKLAQEARTHLGLFPAASIQVGGLAEELSHARLALASTGTVLLECAYFGVPAVALYKTSWITHQIGKRIVQVKFLSMPNLLANEAVYPEFIQDAATPENLANTARELLVNARQREEIKTKLAKIMASLGGPGGSRRAAQAIGKLVNLE